MAPQAAKPAEKPSAQAAPAAPAEQDVTFEEALDLGVWPQIGLAPMDDTDHTLEGVSE